MANREALKSWLVERITDAQAARDITDPNKSSRAYGYWDGIYEAHSATLRHLS